MLTRHRFRESKVKVCFSNEPVIRPSLYQLIDSVRFRKFRGFEPRTPTPLHHDARPVQVSIARRPITILASGGKGAGSRTGRGLEVFFPPDHIQGATVAALRGILAGGDRSSQSGQPYGGRNLLRLRQLFACFQRHLDNKSSP